MTKSLLDELKTACQSSSSPGDAERVAEGESVWLAGRPVPAERGLIGLSRGEGHTTFVSESAVREVVKEEPFYFVRVPAGTAVLVRSEAVATVRVESHGCGCKDDQPSSGTSTLRKAPGGSGGGTGPIIIKCPLVCRYEMDCEWHLGKDGFVIPVCTPILFCRRECPSEPA